MFTYDILLVSLNRRGTSNVTKWVRGLKANSLTQASDIAIAMYPSLGITPTQVSMGWRAV